MSDSTTLRKWIPRAWIALLVIAITPIFLPFLAYGIYSGCNYFGVPERASTVCDNAGVLGFAAFAWYPYILLACAIFAVVLLVVQLRAGKADA